MLERKERIADEKIRGGSELRIENERLVSEVASLSAAIQAAESQVHVLSAEVDSLNQAKLFVGLWESVV